MYSGGRLMLLYDFSFYKINNNISIYTTGCELCIYDACKFAGTLDLSEKAIVFNTCSFIKDREIENKLLLNILKKVYPDRKLYVLGCDVDYQRDYYDKIADVTHTNMELRDIIAKNSVVNMTINEHDKHPSIYVKIQDGCHNRCTYCIIHKLRGTPMSVPYDTIVEEVKTQMKLKGYDKVVLGGTEFTTYYDSKYNYTFTQMLEHLIHDVKGIKRIVLNGFDPHHEETEKIIRLVGKYPEVFVPHVILSTQSACDTILKAMGRRHNVDRLRYLHQVAEECGVSLGWDIIVGFPGETEELFMETYRNMQELHPFSRTLFSYSPREGTPAFKFPNQIPEEVKAERVRRLQELRYTNSLKYNSQYNNYNEYIENDGTINQCKENKRKALEILSNGGKETYLDIFNTEEIVDFLKELHYNEIVHVNYDTNRELESGIIINLIKQLYKGLPLIVHVPSDFKENPDIFEKCYQCIIRRENG